jgi:cobalamin biosynthesis protein CobC
MKHGGDLSEAIASYGGSLESWLDLSTGINPVPWPASAELLQAGLHRLPSRSDEAALIDAARLAYRITTGVDIAIAPGTQALIQCLPHQAAAGPVAIAVSTYSEHALAWSHGRHEIVPCDDIRKVPSQARHAVIVNPNNPDGRTVPLDVIAAIASVLRQRDGWLVVDEAFADLEPELSATALCAELPILVLRSFGKFYGLPGLRLGFAIAAPGIIQRIRAALGPWPVSTPALTVGAAALNDQAWASDTRRRLKLSATRLDAVLQSAGCDVIGGTSLFRLVRRIDAGAFHDKLARQHVWCRTFDWASDLLRFGLPPDDGFDRISKALA